MAEQEVTFRPRDTLSNTFNFALQTTIGGTILAGARNTLMRQNVGAMGIFTQSGYIIGIFASGGIAYQFTKDVSSNLRTKEDCWSEAIGGFAAGATMAISKRSLAWILGMGAAGSTLMSLNRYTNGIKPNAEAYPDDNEVERKEEEKLRRRRPILETIEELGEGRGIYAPGYAERRRQRLLERYGIDVKAAEESG